MRVLVCVLCALWTVGLAVSAQATECDNAGAAPATAPDDTGDGTATACGESAVAGGDASTALGFTATAPGNFSAALGYTSTASGPSSASIGYTTTASGVAATAVGYTANAAGLGALALGRFASAAADDSIAIGRSASATATGSVALGNLALADQPGTIIIGAVKDLNFATDYANVGMGTNVPVQAVDVERSGAAARFQLTSFTAVADEAPQYIQRRARGTRGAPTAVQNNDNLGLFSFRGHNGTSMGGSRATITAQAAGNFTVSSTPTRLIFATTPVGSTTPQQVMVITPDGKVQVNGQNLNVPDYVFGDDYRLLPLEELRTFIDQNGHLPGIASAGQVNEEGLDLAGTQMGLLQKVEELTLYTLQQQDLLAAQQERIGQLEARLEQVLANSH